MQKNVKIRIDETLYFLSQCLQSIVGLYSFSLYPDIEEKLDELDSLILSKMQKEEVPAGWDCTDSYVSVVFTEPVKR